MYYNGGDSLDLGQCTYMSYIAQLPNISKQSLLSNTVISPACLGMLVRALIGSQCATLFHVPLSACILFLGQRPCIKGHFLLIVKLNSRWNIPCRALATFNSPSLKIQLSSPKTLLTNYYLKHIATTNKSRRAPDNRI